MVLLGSMLVLLLACSFKSDVVKGGNTGILAAKSNRFVGIQFAPSSSLTDILKSPTYRKTCMIIRRRGCGVVNKINASSTGIIICGLELANEIRLHDTEEDEGVAFECEWVVCEFPVLLALFMGKLYIFI